MSHKKLHILINKEDIVFYTIYPILINKNQFHELGYKIKFFFNVTKNFYDCDVLILISKPTKSISRKIYPFCKKDHHIEFLKNCKTKVKKIIWYDNSDSSSVTNFEVMPFIEVYLKKQIFKDKNLYKKKFYGGRIFTDFYNKKFNIIDEPEYKSDKILETKFFNKLKLGWNIGIGNTHNSFNQFYKIVRRIFPFYIKKTSNIFISPNNKSREIDFFFRGSVEYERNTIRFHREKLVIDLKKSLKKSKYTAVIRSDIFSKKKIPDFVNKASGRLSNKQYKFIQDSSKISFSPFGWGELGARDYEIIGSGSLLVKPNIDHMKTWPNIFFPYESYVPLNWDFSNLDEVIETYISNEKKRTEVIINSQELHKQTINNQGMEKFCEWFLKQIGEKT